MVLNDDPVARQAIARDESPMEIVDWEIDWVGIKRLAKSPSK